MTLAALISAGASAEKIVGSLQLLGVPFELSTEPAELSGVKAIRVNVGHPEEHVHRSFADIRAIIEHSGLPERASARAIKAFGRLAAAEGAVHGKSPEEVTFHEVGAADSIVDLVGSCVALELLGAETITCGPLPMGNGVVPSAHGPLPVPGPATLEILKGSRIRWTGERRETTTPTAAALMHVLTGGDFTEAAPPMKLGAVGYGAGHTNFESVPNLLRAVIGELEGTAEGIELLEANVDDAPGELLGAAVDLLLETGALDAWLEPILMKKNRGAYKICALARASEREVIARLIIRETGTLGVRHRTVGRTVAERRVAEVELPYGRCRIKVGSLDGQDFTAAPEYEDALRLAKKMRLPLPRVYEDARLAFFHQGTREDPDVHGIDRQSR